MLSSEFSYYLLKQLEMEHLHKCIMQVLNLLPSDIYGYEVFDVIDDAPLTVSMNEKNIFNAISILYKRKLKYFDLTDIDKKYLDEYYNKLKEYVEYQKNHIYYKTFIS